MWLWTAGCWPARRQARTASPLTHAATTTLLSRRVGKRLPASSVIRVIDFGSATFNSDYHSTIVSTRHYRCAPVFVGFVQLVALQLGAGTATSRARLSALPLNAMLGSVGLRCPVS